MLFYIDEKIGFENDGLDSFYNGKCEGYKDLTEREQYRHDYWDYIGEQVEDYTECYYM